MKLEYGVYPDFYKPKQFIVQENIKDPDLFVGRKIALTCFWDLLCDLTKGMNDNQAIIAQRKMGKTAFLRRFFNLAFVEQDEIIPMYFCFENKKLSAYEVAEKLGVTWLSQWLAFTTRNQEFLACDKVQKIKNKINDTITDKRTLELLEEKIEIFEDKLSSTDIMTALSAAFAIIQHLSISFNRRVMVIVDEMQELESGNYFDKNGTPVKYADAIFEIIDKPNIWTLASGSSVSMLHYEIVTGDIGNRMEKLYFEPLDKEEAEELISKLIKKEKYKVYRGFYKDIFHLVKYYPYYITKLLMQNSKYTMHYKEKKDFSTRIGLEKAFRFEAFHPKGSIYTFWENHFVENAEKLNSNPTNRPGLTYEMLRYISKHNNLVMTFEHLAEKFKLKDREEAKKRAYQLVAADLARRGTDIFFSIHGIPDPILPLVLPQIQHQKSTKQKGIEIISPESLELMNKRLNKIDKDIKKTKKEVEETGKRVKSIGGDLNRLKGGEFEDKVKEAIKQDTTILNGYKIIGDIERKFVGKRGKSEKDIDLYAMLESKKRKKSKKTQNQRIALAVETKNWKSKVVRGAAQAFVEKVEMAKQQDQLDKIVAIFVNTGGFSAPAQKILEKAGIEVTTGDQWNLSIKITKK